MAGTLIGLFDDESTAQKVAQDLLSQGFKADDISIITSARNTGTGGGQIAAGGQHSVAGDLPGDAKSGVLSALLAAGAEQGEAEYYAEAVRRGSALVTVDADDSNYDAVPPVFDAYDDVDIDDLGGYYRETGFSGYDADAPAYTPEQITAERQSLKLYAEKLSATKQTVQTGEVALGKRVISETQSIDVPVTHEEVVIERHVPEHRHVANAVFGGETITVPLTAEQVTLEKTAVVTGEVSIGKREVVETQRVTDTVRREEAHIHNPDGVELDNADAVTEKV